MSMVLDVIDFETLAFHFQQHDVIDLRHLELREHNKCIVISGIVPSYYLKQFAQEELRRLMPGCKLVNQVIVVAPK